jgi:hypothetical protein
VAVQRLIDTLYTVSGGMDDPIYTLLDLLTSLGGRLLLHDVRADEELNEEEEIRRQETATERRSFGGTRTVPSLGQEREGIAITCLWGTGNQKQKC